ncbi:hypothetical protein GCM10010975_21220 [Comamonas phosphati]|nr:hypothetical protein GCM10010975_21220 [Comamonas phosphati]
MRSHCTQAAALPATRARARSSASSALATVVATTHRVAHRAFSEFREAWESRPAGWLKEVRELMDAQSRTIGRG